jgi:hypothetical protein
LAYSGILHWTDCWQTVQANISKLAWLRHTQIQLF